MVMWCIADTRNSNKEIRLADLPQMLHAHTWQYFSLPFLSLSLSSLLSLAHPTQSENNYPRGIPLSVCTGAKGPRAESERGVCPDQDLEGSPRERDETLGQTPRGRQEKRLGSVPTQGRVLPRCCRDHTHLVRRPHPCNVCRSECLGFSLRKPLLCCLFCVQVRDGDVAAICRSSDDEEDVPLAE